MISKHNSAIGARLNAEGAVDTAQDFYLIPVYDFFVVFAFTGIDMNALGRTYCSTESAANAFFLSRRLISHQGMQTSCPGYRVTLLIRILPRYRPNKQVLQGNSKPLQDLNE